MRPLRILHLNPADEWGGNLAGTFLVCQGLARWGHRVFLAAPAGGAGLERFQQTGVTVLPFEVSSKWDLAAAGRLARLIRTERIEIVHSHLRPLDWLCFLARPLVRAVWLTTIHGFDVSLDPVTFQPQGGLKNALYRLVLRRGFDRVLTVSQDLAEDAVERLGIDPLKVVHVVNGIELPDLDGVEPNFRERSRRELGLGPEEVAALTVGTVSRRKGQLGLIEAAAPLLAGGRLRLVLVGDGDQLAACQKRAEALGLTGRVIFTGFQEDVRPYLVASDLAVLPSLSEGLPRSLMEAMAWGLPAAASDLAGIRELVGAGEGILVPPGDKEALAGALARLIDDADLRLRLGKAGRRKVEERYDARVMVARHLAVYQAAWRERRIVSPEETGVGDNEVRARKTAKLARRLTKRRAEGLIYGILFRLASPGGQAKPPACPRRVALIYRGMALGDLAVCAPLTRALKRAFPGVEVILLLPERLAAAARLDACVDLIIPYPDKERGRLGRAFTAIRRLRALQPEAAVALGLPFTTLLVTRLSGAAYTLGYDYNHRAWLIRDRLSPHLAHHRSGWEYGRQDKVPYAAEHWARLMARLTGPVDLSWSHVDLGRPRQELGPILIEAGIDPGEPIIGLHPGAAQENRSLTLEQAGYLARRLAGLGRVVFSGGPAEADFCRQAAQAAGVASLAGRLTLAQSWAFTQLCRVVVAVDTGMAHLSAAAGTPVVTLFTQGDPLLWAPYQFRCLAVVGGGGCQRCKSGSCNQSSLLCRESLDLDQTVRLAEQILTEGGIRRPGCPEPGRSRRSGR